MCHVMARGQISGWDQLIRETKDWTYDSRPMTSQSSCPSLRLSLLMRPASLISSTPAIHSSVVSCTSRAKSWMCEIRAPMTSRSRGLVLGPMASMTFWVNSRPKTAPFCWLDDMDVVRGMVYLISQRGHRGVTGTWEVVLMWANAAQGNCKQELGRLELADDCVLYIGSMV